VRVLIADDDAVARKGCERYVRVAKSFREELEERLRALP
jgi:hypothetical protein